MIGLYQLFHHIHREGQYMVFIVDISQVGLAHSKHDQNTNILSHIEPLTN